MDEPADRTEDDADIRGALRDVERLFDQLTEAVEEIIGITTADASRNVYLSPAFDLITGTSRERVLADPVAYLELVHPDDHQVLIDAHERRNQTHEYTYRIVRPDGEERWLHARSFPIRGADGALERIATITRDVTRAKHTERQLAEQRTTLASVAASLTALLTSDDSDAGITHALQVLAQGVGVDRVYVARHEHHPETGDVDLRITHDWTREGATLVFGSQRRSVVRVPPSQLPLLDRMEQGQALSIRRSDLPSEAQLAVAGGMRSLLMVPVIDSRGCWGHVGLVDADEEHDWPDEIRSVLETAAAAIGNAVARHRTMRELERQIERTSSLYTALANPTLPVDEQVQRALATISRLLRMEEASLVRLPEDESADRTEVVYAHPIDSAHAAGSRVPFDRASFERAVADGAPTAVADFVGTPLEGHPVHREGFRSFFGFPICVNGRLWGGLALLSRRPREEPFLPTDGDLLKLVARGIGLMLEQIEAEQRQRQYEEQFRETQRLESLGVLAGGIAHDFNNLLMGVMGNASLALMETEGSSPRLTESLEQIMTAAKRASELTRQMLAYAGKGSMTVKPLSLAGVVEEIGELLETVLPVDARIEYELADDLPLILGDESQVQQVVMNLITNAADALEGGAGSVRVTAGCEDVGPGVPEGRFVAEDAPAGPYVFVEVRDDGIGMDWRTIDRIFEPFFTTKLTGRGLGLAAVLGIVRSHHGALRVQSTPGRGTTFRVLFPAARGAQASARAEAEGPSVRRVEGRVLVVDDVPQVRGTVRRMLESQGLEVLEAADGEEAVRLVGEQGEELVAVVLDLTMPRLDGAHTHDRIRAWRPRLPVVVVSGFAEDEALSAVARDPWTTFLQKPFRAEDIIGRLAEVLEAADG